MRTLFGILFLLSAAYLGGHPRVLRFETRLGLSRALASGLLFVVLGLLARWPVIGILNDGVLDELSPLLRLGLGCIGFFYGFRFDLRLVKSLPSGGGRLVGLSTMLPFVLVVAASALALTAVAADGEAPSFSGPSVLRDALCLGTAAALSNRPAHLYAGRRLMAIVGRLEELFGIAGLMLIAAYFRPHAAGTMWQLPGAAWLLLTIGLGAVMGAVIYAVLQTAQKGPELLAVSLGTISFAAGAAGYLHLSSVVVTFIAGALVANLPGGYHTKLRHTLRRLERPIVLLSLVIVGALWRPDDWRGWLLMPVFAGARHLGKRLAARASRGLLSELPAAASREALAVTPLGTLAVAVVINTKLLYPGGSLPLIVSAVLGGALLTELYVGFVNRRSRVGDVEGST